MFECNRKMGGINLMWLKNFKDVVKVNRATQVESYMGIVDMHTGNHLQYSCLENSMDRQAWQGSTRSQELDMT